MYRREVKKKVTIGLELKGAEEMQVMCPGSFGTVKVKMLD